MGRKGGSRVSWVYQRVRYAYVVSPLTLVKYVVCTASMLSTSNVLTKLTQLALTKFDLGLFWLYLSCSLCFGPCYL